MPVNPTHPGVYIEEVPSGVRTIRGVATSIGAFVGYFNRGPMDTAVRILSFGDFTREFGGLRRDDETGHAVQQFFANGGGQAWVVRVAGGTPAAAGVNISDAVDGGAALTVAAANPGVWGNSLRARVDSAGAAAGEFNLTISEVATVGGRINVLQEEIFRNLSMTDGATNNVATVVNDPNTGSRLVRVTDGGATAPLDNGTFSGTHGSNPTVTAAAPEVSVTIGGTTRTASLPAPAGGSFPGAFSLSDLARSLEAAIRAAEPTNRAFTGATVRIQGTRLHLLPGESDPETAVSIANEGGDTTADELALTGGATNNVGLYELGVTTAVTGSGQVGGALGSDGSVPDSAALIGDEGSKTGLYALEDADLFNLLCIPTAATFVGSSDGDARAVTAAALNYSERRRAFFVVDTPPGIDNPREVEAWLADHNEYRHRNAAIFFPRVQVPDPVNDFRLTSFGASGTVAGLFARTDATRGVWKAPAGSEASLRGVARIEYNLTDAENGVLNPLAINCLRNLPVYGNVCWGSRTLVGSDQQASEWQYVPVRRLALFLEESLYRGTQWVVFEPNDEPLWSQVRLNVGAFMHQLFRQGAFQGQTPRDAYFVRCDSETTTQDDINRGVVNIVVGFAPLRPAEFVIIRLQQIAGQTPS